MGHRREDGRALLDIGMGRGKYLELAQAGGWQVLGTELSPTLHAIAVTDRDPAKKVIDFE